MITERAIDENDTTEIDSGDPWMRIKRARASADEVIAGLAPNALAYATAFDRVNDEIDLVIANVVQPAQLPSAHPTPSAGWEG